jgi:hypothetical protein
MDTGDNAFLGGFPFSLIRLKKHEKPGFIGSLLAVKTSH